MCFHYQPGKLYTYNDIHIEFIESQIVSSQPQSRHILLQQNNELRHAVSVSTFSLKSR